MVSSFVFWMTRILLGLTASTVADRGCPVIAPISPTVVTGSMTATRTFSSVTIASLPVMRTYISSLGLPLLQICSPA